MVVGGGWRGKFSTTMRWRWLNAPGTIRDCEVTAVDDKCRCLVRGWRLTRKQQKKRESGGWRTRADKEQIKRSGMQSPASGRGGMRNRQTPAGSRFYAPPPSVDVGPEGFRTRPSAITGSQGPECRNTGPTWRSGPPSSAGNVPYQTPTLSKRSPHPFRGRGQFRLFQRLAFHPTSSAVNGGGRTKSHGS